ncbi:MAG: hypothetical protein M1819_002834 [Sarea resinae]|nr:MAG: hypothetical protein M1819_002834 [Sarea resinae]
MAAPESKTLADLSGDWVMDKTLSDDPDPILALQGVGWFLRTAISLATITLHIKQYTDDENTTHIDIEQTATGGISGTTENRKLDWQFREHTDGIFGHVQGKSRWITLEEVDDEFLKKGWLAEIQENGAIESFVESLDSGWTADQDLAPDIYETPALTDDASTLPTSATARSNSPASSRFDSDDESNPEISRQRLSPDQARTQFSSARVGAKDVDFSDRISGKRKSYKVSSRRRRKGEDGVEELGDLSDEEDESLERKFARLRREVEEIKAEFQGRAESKTGEGAGDELDKELIVTDGINDLSKILNDLSTSHEYSSAGAGSKLLKDLGTSLKINNVSQVEEGVPEEQGNARMASYTVTYAPSYEQTHALAKAADFDTRLSLLERALGINSYPYLDLEDQLGSKTILPTLNKLDQQISTLTRSSASSFDTIGRRVRLLTQEAEKLSEARQSSKSAQDALAAQRAGTTNQTSGSGEPQQGSPVEDPEQVSKINALYGTLATIESLTPLLPPVLDRLRSLRAIHADAATASESLERIESRQQEMETEIKRWTEGLEKVEEAMKSGEAVSGNNVKVVESWVKDLEARLARLS